VVDGARRERLTGLETPEPTRRPRERTAPEAAQPGSPPSTSRDRDAHCLTPRLILRRTVGPCGGFRTTIHQVDVLDTASQSGPDGTVGLAPTTDVEIE